MKKIALAAPLAILCVSSAYAQSSVTLYGIIDAGFAYSNNAGGQKLYAMNSGNLQGSRWGLRDRPTQVEPNASVDVLVPIAYSLSIQAAVSAISLKPETDV